MRYRRRPTEVEAVMFTFDMAMGDEPLPEGIRMLRRSRRGNLLIDHAHVLELPEGHRQPVEIGDFVVTAASGERRVASARAFLAQYEAAEGGGAE